MISKRLRTNRNGQMLVPMNVDGGAFEESFINTRKVIALITMLLFTGAAILWAREQYLSFLGDLIVTIIVIGIDQLILRYIIFEEKYYYKMYLKMKDYQISSPAVFWNIVSLRETDDGTIACYGDGKQAVFIRVDRDTIVGKNKEFKETHYDAISDFYKELNTKKLKFVQMNLMEQAGKDPRIQPLSKLVSKTSNKNIAKIVETEIGYIKRVTRNTLFESDYFIIYTDNMNRADNLISDATECICHLLEGAFVGYAVCSKSDILTLLREQYGVKYFDHIGATVEMYKKMSRSLGELYTLEQVNYVDGSMDEVDKEGRHRISTLNNYLTKKVIKNGEWSVKETLRGNYKIGDKEFSDQEYLSYDELLDDIDNIVDEDIDSKLFSGEKIAKSVSDVFDDIMYGEQGE